VTLVQFFIKCETLRSKGANTVKQMINKIK